MLNGDSPWSVIARLSKVAHLLEITLDNSGISAVSEDPASAHTALSRFRVESIADSAHTKSSYDQRRTIHRPQTIYHATVSQEVDGLRKELKVDINRLDEKLDTIQDAIAETLTHTTEATDDTLQDHEQRLRRLEHRSVA